MEKKVNKLVRDNIPQRIKAGGRIQITRQLDEGRFHIEAKKKLVEESQEVLASKSRDDLVEELADVLEVVSAIAGSIGITQTEIEEARKKKSVENGAFEKRIFLESIRVDTDI